MKTDHFDPNLILDSDNCRSEEKFMQFVKDEENFDREGINKGKYEFDLNKKFSILFIIDGTATETIETTLAGLPHADKLNVFTITK